MMAVVYNVAVGWKLRNKQLIVSATRKRETSWDNVKR
jgi:hypothetical protein